MSGGIGDKISNKEKVNKGRIEHIKRHKAWWILCMLAVVAVIVSDMEINAKVIWILVLTLMAYYAPKINAYLQRKIWGS